MDVKIISTEDGSHTILNTILDETYHSKHGAIQESVHVFIRHGFSHFVDKHPLPGVRILEVGFGTGLNALLTIRELASGSAGVHYTCVEPYPLDEELAASLNYPSLLTFPGSADYFHRLHAAPWFAGTIFDDRFTIDKHPVPIQDADFSGLAFDIVYFDAFAPSKQPEIWDLPVLAKISSVMAPGGIFVTYSARGQLKRDLKSLGLEVETLEGSPGKNEMVRATKT